MRKQLSVFGLFVGMTFWGGIIITALMVGLELVMVRLRLSEAAGLYGNFDTFVSRAGIDKVFLPALYIMCLWLYFACRGANRLTLARLPVSEKVGAVWQGACYLGWFLVLWAAQLMVVLIAFGWFTGASDSRYVFALTPLISFYESGFLHWLSPMRDMWVCVLMALSLTGLAVCLAADSLKRRMRGGFPVSSVLIGGVTAMCFGKYADNECVVGILLCVAITGARIVSFCRMRDTEVY